ncbi:G-protein coupled receptor Mth2 isoform X2 [Cephus cinctus]|nr:G-protein coupled receptor Mth2 isoform X2 [Cephus cinctus]XP_024936117.1 G-protein coupled receptor Mth2 isoform X2 [Cephus cinctus]XP_024936118.1 G-protein coupled receptor Mth2 isoform X2 [Cephus cinctus]
MIDPVLNPQDNFTVINGSLTFIGNLHAVDEGKFCVTTHNETPVAFICFDEEFLESRFDVFGVLNIISALFLIVTILVYIILPELRDLQGKAILSAIVSLTAAYIILTVQQILPDLIGSTTDHICLTLAFLLYYTLLCTFFWLNMVAFDVWKSVWFQHFPIKNNTLYIIFCLIGWGGPICFLIATLITQYAEGTHIKPRIGESSCWFAGYQEKWVYFYGPVAFLLTWNLIYFSMTFWRLSHVQSAYSGSRLRVLRFKCLLYTKLFIVMGVTWIFEVMSFASGAETYYYWIVTDILNSLQGVLIFILLVFLRKRVRKLLAKKKPCGITFPRSWTAGEDLECDSILQEELELSQST